MDHLESEVSAVRALLDYVSDRDLGPERTRALENLREIRASLGPMIRLLAGDAELMDKVLQMVVKCHLMTCLHKAQGPEAACDTTDLDAMAGDAIQLFLLVLSAIETGASKIETAKRKLDRDPASFGSIYMADDNRAIMPLLWNDENGTNKNAVFLLALAYLRDEQFQGKIDSQCVSSLARGAALAAIHAAAMKAGLQAERKGGPVSKDTIRKWLRTEFLGWLRRH